MLRQNLCRTVVRVVGSTGATCRIKVRKSSPRRPYVSRGRGVMLMAVYLRLFVFGGLVVGSAVEGG